MVERRLGRDQRLDDLRMTEVGGGDQRGAVVVAGDRAGIGAGFERDLEQLDVVVDRGDGERVETLQVARVRIGAEPQQRAHRVMMLAVGGHQQRRAAVGILQVRALAFLDQFFDLGDVAHGGGRVQAGIDPQIAVARRRLRRGGGRGCEQRRKSQEERQASHRGTSRISKKTRHRPDDGDITTDGRQTMGFYRGSGGRQAAAVTSQ